MRVSKYLSEIEKKGRIQVKEGIVNKEWHLNQMDKSGRYKKLRYQTWFNFEKRWS